MRIAPEITRAPDWQVVNIKGTSPFAKLRKV
jgi:hypothetical protein